MNRIRAFFRGTRPPSSTDPVDAATTVTPDIEDQPKLANSAVESKDRALEEDGGSQLAPGTPSSSPNQHESPVAGQNAAGRDEDAGNGGDAIQVADKQGSTAGSTAAAPAEGVEDLEHVAVDELCDDATDADASSVRNPLLAGWKRVREEASLSQVHASVAVPDVNAHWYRKFAAFTGLGFIISVGYMDPGNWATDIAGGSAYGYTLLFVVLLSSVTAMFLQTLSLRLGVATERDLAQACRDAYHPAVNVVLWFIAEVGIAATDLAEVIGSATALYLLFGLPIWAGVLITSLDVLVLLLMMGRNFRIFELFIFLLVAVITVCFVYEIAVSKPYWPDVFHGYLPSGKLFEGDVMYNAIGILGATVMPHNLFLHSSIIQTRAYPRDKAGKKMATRYGTIDTLLSLSIAFFVNSAILICAAAVFHYGPIPNTEVATISDAYQLLSGSLGQTAAKILFGVALLAAGQNASITGTLSGQIVMEGFLKFSIPPWSRRLITRLIAIIPAAIVAGLMGNTGAGKLLVLSQVILSFTLSFAVFPLVHFTTSRAKMGGMVIHWTLAIVAWVVAFTIAGLNVYLLVESIRTNSFGGAGGP